MAALVLSQGSAANDLLTHEQTYTMAQCNTHSHQLWVWVFFFLVFFFRQGLGGKGRDP